jgi:CXXX repeat modification system protein
MAEALDVKLTEEELESIRLIVSKKVTADSAMNRTEFPKEMEANLISAFYKAAGENLAEAKYQESKWWKEVTAKYNLGDTSLDMISGILSKVEKKE